MGAITDDILELLADLPYHPYRIIYGSVPKDVGRSRVTVAVHRLKKRGYIQKEFVENEVCLRLTELGKNYLRTKNSRTELLHGGISQKEWDGHWRVVIFDIPENNRKLRAALRLGLKTLEFRQLQKSVWISKLDCVEPLRNYVRTLKLEKYVLAFETGDLGV